MWEHFSVSIMVSVKTLLLYLWHFCVFIRHQSENQKTKAMMRTPRVTQGVIPPPSRHRHHQRELTWFQVRKHTSLCTYTLSIIMYFFSNCGDHEGTVMIELYLTDTSNCTGVLMYHLFFSSVPHFKDPVCRFLHWSTDCVHHETH